jgi:DNA-binding Xre family transcriptional regulator
MNKTKFPKLDGLIVEKFGTRQKFAEAVGISENTIRAKMMAKSPWKMLDIEKICDALDIDKADIPTYFFAL